MVGSYRIKKIIIFQFLALNLFFCNKKNLSKLDEKPFQDFTSLKDCDLVCRLGNGYFSDYFREYGSKRKKYSHIGMIVIQNKVPYVYHCEANELNGVGGIKKEKLKEFLNDIKIFSFFRLKFSKYHKKAIISQANTYLIKHIKFDLRFNSSNDNELYCTEFVANCVNKGTKTKIIIPTLELNHKKIYGLDDIYENNNVLQLFK